MSLRYSHKSGVSYIELKSINLFRDEGRKGFLVRLLCSTAKISKAVNSLKESNLACSPNFGSDWLLSRNARY
jgi:hypothetical protein